MSQSTETSRIPNKIFADKGPLGGWLYRDTEHGDTQHEFIRMGEVRRLMEREIAFLGKESDPLKLMLSILEGI